jgi:predicted RNA-binding Zn-ribbon protein involved in translation (DUF1610 family)
MDLLYICPKCGYDLKKTVDSEGTREVCYVCGHVEVHRKET